MRLRGLGSHIAECSYCRRVLTQFYVLLGSSLHKLEPGEGREYLDLRSGATVQKSFQEGSKVGCTRMKEEKKYVLESENSTIWYDGIYIQRAPSYFYIVQPLESPPTLKWPRLAKEMCLPSVPL